MKRSLLALVFCVVSTGPLSAGDPCPRSCAPPDAAPRAPSAASPAASQTGRRKLEAQLQVPAGLDFGDRQRVSAKEILDQLHDRHHLSIRFDLPTFAALFGGAAPALKKDSYVDQPLAAACYLKDDLPFLRRAVVPVVECPTPLPPANVAPTANYAAPVAVPSPPPAARTPASAAVPAPVPAAAPAAAPAAPRAPAPNPVAPPAALPPPVAAPVAPGRLTPPSTIEGLPPAGLGESKPESPAPLEGEPVAKPAKSPGTQEALDELLKVEIDVQRIDVKNVSVATALRHALGAAPLPTGSEDFGGLPIPLTNAMLLDYLVEEDGLLITTRMKALAHRETRVYSVKHLQDLPPEQLARTVRQAVRPWSWRSQITDLGEQLKGTPIPPETIGSILKTGAQLVGNEIGATVTTADGATAESGRAESRTDEAKAAAMMGNALVNGVVTFVQATLASLEMFHYGEPPTATIQALPGKLVITQSQAGHREIAELLRQLAEE